jgi:hypothetical protein
MTKTPKNLDHLHKPAAPPPTTLGSVLAALQCRKTFSDIRRRDLRSAVNRVAGLLGDIPGAIPLDLNAIGARLADLNPVAAGMTAKRMANIRSDFVAAVKASGGVGQARLEEQA